MNRTAIKWAAASAIIAVCLWVGVSRILEYRASIPPDPATAEPADLAAYTMSDHFARLSPQDQLRFTQESMKRYSAMTEGQKKAIDEQFARLRKQDPDRLRESLKQWFMTLAQQYLDLPPDQRGPWLDRNLAVFAAMGGRSAEGGRHPDPAKQKEREKRENEPLTAERQRQIVEFFQNDAMAKSTAKERAMFMAVIKDLGPRMAAREAAKKK